MRIRRKIGLALVAVAVLPAAISGLSAIEISSAALTGAADAAHRRAADEAATFVSRFLEEAERAVRIGATYTDLRSLSDEERSGALTILYLQLDALTAVALVDRDGRGLVPTVYRTPEEGEDRQLARHEAMTSVGHQLFADAIPLGPTLSTGVGRSSVYETHGGGSRVIVAVALGDAAQARWVLAAEVSLREVEAFLRLAAPAGGHAELVDGTGKILVSSRGPPRGRVAAEWLTGRDRAGRLQDGALWYRGAVALVDGTPWRVVVQRPETLALASTHRLRNQALLWTLVGVAVALFLGFVLSGGLTEPVRRLADAARKIAGGDLKARVQATGGDEIAALGGAFNDMAGELEKSREEIEAWNRELAARVEARTKEIAELQGVLVRSQRMAAVAALGAGVAHEINNPLTGVLGFTQLLLRKLPPGAPEREILQSIEQQSVRIREIVATLMRLTEETTRAKEDVDVSSVLVECLALHESTHAERKIAVTSTFASTLHVSGSRADLKQAFLHVLDNARDAMPDGGSLDVSSADVEGKAVRIRIVDTGRGIEAERLDRVFDPFFTSKVGRWEAKGLGLTVTHRIVEEHDGRIGIESELGKGTTVTVTLPAVVGKGTLLE